MQKAPNVFKNAWNNNTTTNNKNSNNKVGNDTWKYQRSSKLLLKNTNNNYNKFKSNNFCSPCIYPVTVEYDEFCTGNNVLFFAVCSTMCYRERQSTMTLHVLLQPTTLSIYYSIIAVATSSATPERLCVCPRPGWIPRCPVFSNRAIIFLRASGRHGPLGKFLNGRNSQIAVAEILLFW